MEQKLLFNENVLFYDKYRPTYPSYMYKTILDYCGLNKSAKVLEIGCGTGQATKPFLDEGYNVTAIEIGNNLAQYVKRKYADYSNFNVVNEAFEEFECQNDGIDLIYSATAFHWIPQDVGYTKAFDLLKPNACLALWWNTSKISDDCSEVHNKIQDVYSKYFQNENPASEKSETKYEIAKKAYSLYGYRELKEEIFKSSRILNADEYVGLLQTYSDHMKLETNSRLRLLEEMYSLIDKHGSIKLVDTVNLHLGRK